MLKQCQTVTFLIPGMLPLQLADELHQKDLRILLVLVHILGTAMRHVSKGGHVLGLIPNRRLLRVPGLTFTPTCRHFSHTAVSKSD